MSTTAKLNGVETRLSKKIKTMTNIISRNCHGIRNKYDEIPTILHDHPLTILPCLT